MSFILHENSFFVIPKVGNKTRIRHTWSTRFESWSGKSDGKDSNSLKASNKIASFRLKRVRIASMWPEFARGDKSKLGNWLIHLLMLGIWSLLDQVDIEIIALVTNSLFLWWVTIWSIIDSRDSTFSWISCIITKDNIFANLVASWPSLTWKPWNKKNRNKCVILSMGASSAWVQWVRLMSLIKNVTCVFDFAVLRHHYFLQLDS